MQPYLAAIAGIMLAVASVTAGGQDVAKIATLAYVEKATGLRFQAPSFPIPTQAVFQQEGGNVQVSVSVEPREASTTVRSWEATMKRMQPNVVVSTVPGIGKDAIFASTRADLGSVWVDFDKPLVQLAVGVSGARDPAQARQYVTAVAKAVAPTIGK